MKAENSKNRAFFTLDREKVNHFSACSAERMSMASACREVGCDPKTPKAAAERAGLTDWLNEKFPGTGYEIRHTKPAACEIRESLHFRAATMSWRKAA